MKHMHFRASCSYAALAELLAAKGVDTEDDRIALEMKLPWLFAKEDDAYLAGPMLQGAKWFDLWLKPRGYRMQETFLDQEALCPFLRERRFVMLGLQTPQGKHAVVLREYNGKYHFINPTREGSGEDAEWSLDEAELLERTNPIAVVGEVVSAEPETPELLPLLTASACVLRENVAAIEAFAAQTHAPEDYLPAMDSLFRPLLLDGITMLELAGETKLARDFAELQGAFLRFLRGPRSEPLAEMLSMQRLHELSEEYVRLIVMQESDCSVC